MIDINYPIFFRDDFDFEFPLEVLEVEGSLVKLSLPRGRYLCSCRDSIEESAQVWYDIRTGIQNGHGPNDEEPDGHYFPVCNGPDLTPKPSLEHIGLID